MRLDVAKIDDRIRKLQELRRIACDPEMAMMIAQCMAADDSQAPGNAAEPGPGTEGRMAPPENRASAPGEPDEAEAVIKGVMKGERWKLGAR